MGTHYDTRRTQTPYMTDAEILEAAADLVDDFMPLAEELQVGLDILDEGTLPASRQSFESGFRLAIATTMQPSRRGRLVAAGMLLAQFQPNVGRRISLSPAPCAGAIEEGQTLFGACVHELMNRAEHDRARLEGLFAEADAMARRRFEMVAYPPFHVDGTYSWHGHSGSH